VVGTFSHPAISVPLLLKATVPGAEVVAVIVSTDPYVGVAVLSARVFVVVILATVIVTGVVVPSESVDNLYGVQLDFVSYRSGSDGTQSYVRLVEAAVDGVQVQVVVHGDALTDLLAHPEIVCPAALKEIVPGIWPKDVAVISTGVPYVAVVAALGKAKPTLLNENAMVAVNEADVIAL